MVVTLTRNAGDANMTKKRERHRDDGADEYACHDDSHASYISSRLDCDEAAPMSLAAARRHFHQRRYTAAILVSISTLTVLVVATFILVLGLVVGRRYWRRSVDVDYCKHRQSQLLQHEHHPGAQPDEPAASRRLLLLLAWWLRRCCPCPSSGSSTSSVGYRQVIGAELDVTSSSADVSGVTSAAH